MTDGDWSDPHRRFLGLRLADPAGPVLIYLHAGETPVAASLPSAPQGRRWQLDLVSDESVPAFDGSALVVPARAVVVLSAPAA